MATFEVNGSPNIRLSANLLVCRGAEHTGIGEMASNAASELTVDAGTVKWRPCYAECIETRSVTEAGCCHESKRSSRLHPRCLEVG